MGTTIKVRSRRLERGKSARRTVYLDFYERGGSREQPGRRRLEYLELYLSGGRKKKDRERDANTLAVAEDIAAKRRLELKNQEEGFPAEEKQKADFIAYGRALGESKRSPNTRLVWCHAFDHLETFAHREPVSFARLNTSLLEGFRDYLLAHLKPNSALVYLARIKTACHRALKERIIARNPAADVSIKKQKTRREFLTLQELERLAATPCGNQETRAAFLFSAFAGLRYSDVRALTWAQVRRADGAAEIVYTQQKTKEQETLPLSEQALAILDAQAAGRKPKASDLVFDLPAQQTMDKAIRRWVKRAGIGKTISFHNARHTFATLELTHGADIYTVSKLLGHTQLETTAIYTEVIGEKKRAAVRLLPTLNGNGESKGGAQ